jgi:hypothetical protein
VPARELITRGELCRSCSMAVGTVRHAESIVLERIESAGAGSPRYAAVQRGRLRPARVGRRLLHFVSLLRLGARISRHAGHRRYDRGGNGGSNSLVEHLGDFQNSAGARTTPFVDNARKVDQRLALFFVLRAGAAMVSARRRRVPGLLPESDLPRVSVGLRAPAAGRPF